MDQDQIWDHYQNVATTTFTESYGRNAFLAKKLRRGIRVLNIGVGVLILERLAQAREVEMYALDPSAASIEKATLDLGLGERAKVGHSQAIPFQDSFFDVVIMSEVLEHLGTAHLSASINEIWRVLKPGGSFIGTVPFDEDLEASNVACPHCHKTFHRWGHQQRFTTESLATLLKTRFPNPRCQRKKFITWRARSGLAKVVAVAKLIAHRFGARIPDESIYFEATKL